ncbi:MAG: hypothetical protein KGM15_10960 [Pseudomonadota bacterium]|nr:hypothetical protein [Pseudomonadota bacterium]
MAVSQSQRLRKAAAKAAKRKVVVAEKLARDRRELSISKPRHIDFAACPIVACLVTENFESVGISTLTVMRKLSLGRYGIAVFLLDFWCLGVKDAFFRVAEADEYELYIEELEAGGGAEPIEPARARRLVREAVAYGASNGFSPPAEFAEVERIFGDIEAAEATFAFSDNGRPHFVVGQHDSRARCEHICAVLEQRFGRDGYDVTYPLEDDDEDDGMAPDQQERIEGPPRR